MGRPVLIPGFSPPAADPLWKPQRRSPVGLTRVGHITEPESTRGVLQNYHSFDHLVGAREQRRRHVEA
jgi:hypothetical protein